MTSVGLTGPLKSNSSIQMFYTVSLFGKRGVGREEYCCGNHIFIILLSDSIFFFFFFFFFFAERPHVLHVTVM